MLLGRKAMTNLDSILRNRDITLPTKVHIIKAIVFPVVMCVWESWNRKKAECQRVDVFKLWCWRRLLRVPWTARRSNQPILKEIIPEYSLEGLMLKLKLQYFAHLMWRTDSLEKTLKLGKLRAGGEGGPEDKMTAWHHWFNGHEFEQTPEIVKDREAWRGAVHGVARSWAWLSDWKTTTTTIWYVSSESYAHLLYLIISILWNCNFVYKQQLLLWSKKEI